MKKLLCFLAAIACASALSMKPHSFSIRDTVDINLSGYVKHESFADSRQIVSLREGEYLLYPKNRDFDATCNDTNAAGQFNMSVIQTRFRGEMTCPDIWNAKPNAVFEADFFGLSATIEEFRIRHAFARIDWKHVSLLAGHTWHPMFIPACSPNQISFNTGAPIEPFGRAPQIRGTIHAGPVDLLFAALTQLETVCEGPDGPNNKYLRNNIFPNLHWQLRAKVRTHTMGAGIDFKRIIPRLKTNENIRHTETISSFAVIAFCGLNWDSIALNMKVAYGQNMTDFVMLGGYAVRTVDPETDYRTYTPLQNVSVWWDFAIKKSVEPGFFLGITKNLGARHEIIQEITDEFNTVEKTIYARSPEIDTVFRFAPRVRWHIKPVTVCAELEYTRAGYGTIEQDGSVSNAKGIGNTRFMFALFYYF